MMKPHSLAHFVGHLACSEMLHYLDQMDNYSPYLYTALHHCLNFNTAKILFVTAQPKFKNFQR